MFIALIKSDSVDAKVCTVPSDSETRASHYEHRPDAEIYVGIFRTWDDKEATRQAAEKAGVDPKNIRVIQLVAQ